MKKTYYLHSLGCKVNSYENAAVGTELSSHGFVETTSMEEAGVILLNTCSVTGRADQKSRQHISSLRKGNSEAILVVMGCYSQGHSEAVKELGADIVLGAASRSEVYQYICDFIEHHQQIVDIHKSIRREKYEELGATAFCENARAYLKVQDGCDNFCSYCYIPFLRGNSRSREPRSVLEEAMALTDAGYQEIIISGIHIGAYGKDLADGSYRLTDLLESMTVKCPDLARIRISSIEESEIDDAFLSLLKTKKQIVDHLHIPLQSGSSSVLKRMKRHYDTDAFLAKLEAIRAIRPDIAITTDVIAGYPEESDEEWQETMEFCRKARFAEIHVFPFSSRPGTYAATLKDLDPRVKKARVHELLDLSKKMREEYKAKFYEKETEVLFEDYNQEKGLAYGHTSNYLMVAIPSEIPLHGKLMKITFKSECSSD